MKYDKGLEANIKEPQNSVEEWYPTYQQFIQSGLIPPVISIPPLFTLKARSDLSQALKETGFIVKRMLSSPVAVTLAFAHLSTTPSSCIAISIGTREQNIDICIAEFFESNSTNYHATNGLIEILFTYSFSFYSNNSLLNEIKEALTQVDLKEEYKLSFVGLYNMDDKICNEIQQYLNIPACYWDKVENPVNYGLNILTQTLDGKKSSHLTLLDLMELTIMVYICVKGVDKTLGIIKPRAIPLKETFYYGEIKSDDNTTIKLVQISRYNKLTLLQELLIPDDTTLNKIIIYIDTDSQIAFEFMGSNNVDSYLKLLL